MRQFTRRFRQQGMRGLLPGDVYDIQQAALELCKGMWLARQRDPSVTMESVPDVHTVQYGEQGRNGAPIGAIPPNVQELLLPYKEFKL